MHAFSDEFQSDLETLMRWRRDVRRFRPDPVDEVLLNECLDAFLMAPSVGLSEPWRVIRVESDAARAAALANYQAANMTALAGYSGEKAKIYAGLKLSGMQDAPVQLAIFCDETTEKGSGLGSGTMPEMRRYSVVSAIMLFWLAARARGLGLGWVSILDPEQICRDLDVPANYSLVGYFCLGWPEDVAESPELEGTGWEARRGNLPLEVR
ncbi:5,6-dimethylbenzimidazole synthase [Aliiroseovarius sp. KMU-50]|uniref:5,6-dimethylbenzimidazole synthase n=1 Tax=Aliiroseovarius salicola TaxID=3009082 RepID=A0ABT4W0R8_9RHOB|nr:5,6-dimethylbenzimidazole synthase [Aliiroseovarius sp. KMU-50]MDA5093595.1 5,6-dimethylbenzimidazole synthase [Aliiroseovarius sp. KMU-50]